MVGDSTVCGIVWRGWDRFRVLRWEIAGQEDSPMRRKGEKKAVAGVHTGPMLTS